MSFYDLFINKHRLAISTLFKNFCAQTRWAKWKMPIECHTDCPLTSVLLYPTAWMMGMIVNNLGIWVKAGTLKFQGVSAVAVSSSSSTDPGYIVGISPWWIVGRPPKPRCHGDWSWFVLYSQYLDSIFTFFLYSHNSKVGYFTTNDCVICCTNLKKMSTDI